MTFRKILFWLHLTAGAVAGLIVLLMSVTGVLLTYEKQILGWTDRRAAPVATSPPMNVEALLAKVRENTGSEPTNLTLRSGAGEPATLTLRGERGVVLVDPATGEAVAPQPASVRRFFRSVTDWHRWLGASPEGRARARIITGACNLAFLFLVVSGLYLWFPRNWKWSSVRAVLWFRGGLSGRPRNFNWHNTAGFWCCIPLFFVVLSGVVISYPWASDLVYRTAGTEPPAQGKGKGKEKGKLPLRPAPEVAADFSGLDVLVAQAQTTVPDWRSITFTIPTSHHEPVTVNIDTSIGGQPQNRSSLTFHRKTGHVDRPETFSDQDAGRRARSWMRFVHTGEYYGIVGQTIAGIASAGGALLVWTGLALAWRRFRTWYMARFSAR